MFLAFCGLRFLLVLSLFLLSVASLIIVGFILLTRYFRMSPVNMPMCLRNTRPGCAKVMPGFGVPHLCNPWYSVAPGHDCQFCILNHSNKDQKRQIAGPIPTPIFCELLPNIDATFCHWLFNIFQLATCIKAESHSAALGMVWDFGMLPMSFWHPHYQVEGFSGVAGRWRAHFPRQNRVVLAASR